MEQINRIEVRGLVGSVRIQQFNGRKVANFTVATNRAYRDQQGVAQIETTWHTVVAWEGGRNIDPLDKITKGSKVYVMGRMSYRRFTGSDGQEHYASEIQATQVQLLDDKVFLQDEM